MRKLKLEPHLSTEELKALMNAQTHVRHFKDYQILYLAAIHEGCTSHAIASMLGITHYKVLDTVSKYNKGGADWKVGKQWGGRREERCLMSLEEERTFLQSIEEEALNGEILTYKQIKSALEIRLGKSISDDYVWDLFKRHDWRKKAPRKSHPRADKSAQEEYKKKLPELLAAKQLEFDNEGDTRPVKLFFQDESRFGRIDNPVSCWVPKGGRAVVGSQIVREYTYLYGAFCPETGEQFSMVLPYANGECMTLFLTEFSKEFSDYRVIMAMDNASWHSACSNADNIVPLFQPAYSPQVNPAENVWRYVKENGGFKNRTFDSMQEVEQQLVNAVNTLLTDKETVKSITGFKWILDAV